MKALLLILCEDFLSLLMLVSHAFRKSILRIFEASFSSLPLLKDFSFYDGSFMDY